MLNILLVDDDAEFTDVAANIIEILGHTVSVAINLSEAYELVGNQQFDHILLDFVGP